MNSEALKIKYLECKRGGFHEGELLNIVCLNEQCKSNALCCCICVDESHKGHKTTTLKKIVIDSKEAVKQLQSSNKEQVKPSVQLNNDIICNLIESSKKDAFQELEAKSNKIRTSLKKIEEQLKEYYKSIEQIINQQDQPNPSLNIFQSIENIQGASTLQTMEQALKQLLISLQEVKKSKTTKSNRKQHAQESIINLICNSNKEVADSTLNRLTEIQNQLQIGCQAINKSTENVKSLFNKEVFYFSSQLKSQDIWITDSYKAVSKKGQTYQTALMQPSINQIDDITAFRFKINKATANWVALGMCHKKILQKKNFVFDYKTIGHGCYMISSNAGSWSHLSQQLNNKVKAFNFKQGDIITCVVNKKMKEIFFTKQVKPGSLTSALRQFHEIPYHNDPYDELHPCVVFYYANDEIEYLPATNLNNMPKYNYLFSNVEKHPKVKVIDNKIIRALEGNAQYRAVLLNRSLEQNFQTSKKFSFKILKSTNNWVAVGMCHYQTVTNFGYGFDFKGPFHGYYMISSNGGTWSTIDSTKNNVVRAFKFKQGDIIDCEVVFGQNPTDLKNKIIFRKGTDSYELNFKGVSGDRLYPCAMLHFPGDQIAILPTV